MIKIAHISDIHYAPETLEEVDRCFRFAVDAAIDNKCDIAVITGDTFDHQIPLHSKPVAAVLQAVSVLADAMPVIILQGTASHDAPGSLDVFRTVRGKYPVLVVDRICQVLVHTWASDGKYRFSVSEDWQLTQSDCDTDELANTRILFCCLPSIDKGKVAAAAGAEDAAIAAGEMVHELMRGWSVSNREFRERGIPVVGLAHGTVVGCETEHGVPMAGLDHEFTTGSLFAAECDVWALGHIHKHQVFRREESGQLIAYPGSVGRLHYGEKDPKGFIVWKFEGGPMALPGFTFIETPAKRLLEYTFEGPPDEATLTQLAKDAEGAYVRIRYDIPEDRRHEFDRKAIAAQFEAAGAAAIKVEPRIIAVERTRAAGITRVVSIYDKFQTWCATADVQSEPLIPRLQQIESREPEDIVKEIVK